MEELEIAWTQYFGNKNKPDNFPCYFWKWTKELPDLKTLEDDYPDAAILKKITFTNMRWSKTVSRGCDETWVPVFIEFIWNFNHYTEFYKEYVGASHYYDG